METFTYEKPKTIRQAIALLSATEGARPLMGGTDLVIQLAEKAIQTPLLVDLSGIPDLRVLRDDGAQLTIGAAVTHAQLRAFLQGNAHYRALADAAASVGTPQVRNLGSVVGNLCNAVPSADLGAPVLLYESLVHTAGAEARVLPMTEFFTGPRQTALRPGEVVTHITIPCRGNGVSAYEKFSPRRASDLATVGVAAYLAMDAAGCVREVRIALGAVAPTPIRIELEGYQGQSFGPAFVQACAHASAAGCAPITDFRAGAAYRRHIVAAYVERLLNQCASAQRGGGA